MSRSLRTLALLLLLSGLPALAYAQATATLRGTVVADDTGEPLEGVHVFIAVSQMGTVTDTAGRFELAGVPVGAHRLYVSAIGFEPEARDVMLREPRLYPFDFRLRPAVYEADEVVVEGKRDKRWAQRLEKFKRLFLGETPNAEHTTLVNPEVLDFDETIALFKARASAPLVIENRALGYRVTYFLKEFEATNTRTRYDGEPLFEEMEPADAAEAAQWQARRREAFTGSFRHFLLALLAGKTEEQGFLTYGRSAESPQAGALGTDVRLGQQRFPLEAATILKPGESPVDKKLDFKGFVEIIYQDELESDAYRAWQRSVRRGDRYQTSWIYLDKGATTIDYKGDVLDPYGVTLSGYLAFERVADELPKEYRPGR